MKKTLELLEMALQEDEYQNDITTNNLIDPTKIGSANYIAKSTGVVSGVDGGDACT